MTTSKNKTDGFREVSIDLILPNPHNKGDRIIQDDTDEAFVESIRKHGVLNPVTVRAVDGGRFMLIAGERRWWACKQVGRPTIRIIERDKDSASLDSDLTLTENFARRDYTDWEKLVLLVDLVTVRQREAEESELPKPTIDELARSVGMAPRKAQRYWTIDGKLDEKTRTIIAGSPVLRRNMVMADLERVAGTHSRERASVLANLEKLYEEANNPRAARRAGLAAGAGNVVQFQYKKGRDTIAKCIIKTDSKLTTEHLMVPMVDLGVRIHPLCDLKDDGTRQAIAAALRTSINKLVKALEQGKTGQEDPPAGGKSSKRSAGGAPPAGGSPAAGDGAPAGDDEGDDDGSELADGEGSREGMVTFGPEEGEDSAAGARSK